MVEWLRLSSTKCYFNFHMPFCGRVVDLTQVISERVREKERERLVLGDDMVEWLSIKSERRESAGERLKLRSILVVEWLSSEFN